MPMCLFVRTEELDSHWTDFRGILNELFLPKSAYTIQPFLRLGKNNNHFTRRPVVIYDSNPTNCSWIEKTCTYLMVKKSDHIVHNMKYFLKILPFMEQFEISMVRKDRQQLSLFRTVPYKWGLCAGYLRQRNRNLCPYYLILYMYLTIQRCWF
jgi:hypothetical protein